MLIPGRHGSMSSSELESIIIRNSDFLSVRRAGRGDGIASLHHAVSGKFIAGIGGGRIPEYSLMRDYAPRLVRGWRNILYDLLHRRHVRPTPEIRRLLGDRMVVQAVDYGLNKVPMATPEPDMQKHGDSWI